MLWATCNTFYPKYKMKEAKMLLENGVPVFSSSSFTACPLWLQSILFSRLNCIPMISVYKCFHSFGILKNREENQNISPRKGWGNVLIPQKDTLGWNLDESCSDAVLKIRKEKGLPSTFSLSIDIARNGYKLSLILYPCLCRKWY